MVAQLKEKTDQKKLKEKYMDIICKEVWVDSVQMQKYARKKCEYVIELSNGNIIDIDKPSIEKNFCFGYGMYARSTDKEAASADACAEHAKTNTDYFIEENMKQITDNIAVLEEALAGEKEVYTFVRYCGVPDTSKLMGWKCCKIWDNPENEPWKWSQLRTVRKLEKEDIQLIIDGYEEVGKRFRKRLQTYLKRYGLSKLNVWTYLRD
jgi:hypothetical protein